MKRGLSHILKIGLLLFAFSARADFDPSRVINLSVQLYPNLSGAEISPYPFFLGDMASPVVTATVVGGAIVSPVPPQYITVTSLNSNAIAISPGPQLTAVGYGTATVNFKVGALTKGVVIKVVPPAAQLAHRYPFDTNADPTLVLDTVGSANGILTNDTPGGTVPVLTNGLAVFDGAGGYVKLPAGTASQFTNLSAVVWITVNNVTNFHTNRLFDFATPDTNSPPGRAAGLALETSPVSLRAGWPPLTNQFQFSWEGAGNGRPTGMLATVAAPPLLLFGAAGSGAQAPKGVSNFPPLSVLVDTDCRIGGSIVTNYDFNGSLAEMRMYEGFLSDYDLALMKSNGPDVVAPVLGELRRIRIAYDSLPLQYGNPTPNTYQVLGDFTGASNVDLIADGLVSLIVPAGTNGPILLIGTNQMKIQGIGPANITVASKLVTSNLAVIPAPIAGPLQVRLQVPSTGVSSRSAPIPYSLKGDYLYVSNVDLTSLGTVHFALSNPQVLQFGSGFTLLPQMPGTCTLSATYSNFTASVQITVTNPPGYAATYPKMVYRWPFNAPVGSYYTFDTITNEALIAEQIYQLINNNAQPVGNTPTFDGVTTASSTGASGYFGMGFGALQSVTNCTIEFWLTCASVHYYYHFFDVFQPSNPYDSNPYLGQSLPLAGCMYLAPASPSGTGGLQAVYQPGGADPTNFYQLQAPSAMTANTQTHIVWVHSPGLGVAELYVNGVQVAATNTSVPFPSSLMTYIWVGRNCTAPNDVYAGTYDELRVYDGALSPVQIQMDYAAGPQALPLGAAAVAYPSFGLQSEPDGQHFKVRVPNPRSGVVLETSSGLGTNAVWSPVTNSVVIESDETATVEVPNSSNAFFRLHLIQ